MASNTSICGICSLRQITKTSDHWCPECEEALCNECKEHHKLLKATRSHRLIPISNYKSLPSFITDIQQSCIYHNEHFQQYCVEHAVPICFKCIDDHRKCNVTILESVTVNIKNSGQFIDLESRLDDLLQNIDIIKKDRKANVTKIEDMKTRHVIEIRQIRVEINKHLDNLERQIITDLEEKEFHCKDNIQAVLSLVKEKETIITQCQANFKSIKQYASDLQTFIGIKDIEVQIQENEKYLQSLIEAKSFEQLDLVCQVDAGVQSILNSLQHFGSIEIKTRTSNIECRRAKDNQAQLQVVATKKTIKDLKLIIKKKITTDGRAVTGCCMSTVGNFVFTDHYFEKYLIVIASDGTLTYRMPLFPSNGFDIAFVDEKTVAITSGDSHKIGIDIINIENQCKIKFVKLHGYPHGITCDRDSLFVCVAKHGIYKVNTVDYNISHVISCSLPSYSYVSLFADKIYYTDYNAHRVVCCDRNGSMIWTFKNELVLNGPRSITVDNDGNAFVVGYRSSSVVIISNDGKHYKEILTNEDDYSTRSAIFFDKQKRELLVTNFKQTAFLYNVT